MADNGGPAFPHMMAKGHRDYVEGMSLRDWFAGQALSSIPLRAWDHVGGDREIIKAWAKAAYALADEMLAARTPQESGRE